MTVAGCLTLILISCMGPKHATKDTYLNFQPIYMHRACACSSNLSYAHYALKTQLMHKKCANEHQKFQNLTQHSCCSRLTLAKQLKSRRGNAYGFIQKGETFPTKTIGLVVRSSGLWEAYPQTCPKWDKKFTMTCWCRSMKACQVSWISDELWIY